MLSCMMKYLGGVFEEVFVPKDVKQRIDTVHGIP